MEEIIEERRPRSPQRRANDGDGRPHRNSQGRAAEADIHDAESITRNNSYERQRPAREPQNDGVPLEGEGLQRARQRSHDALKKSRSTCILMVVLSRRRNMTAVNKIVNEECNCTTPDYEAL